MDRRQRILAALFGSAAIYALAAGVVYPRWIQPLLTLDTRITERKMVLDKLQAEADAVEKSRFDYKTLAGRIGSFDAGRVETDIRERLNQLIDKYKLTDSGVSPSRPVEDRKTGLLTSAITVSAVGTLESAVSFLKEVAELPHLVRIGNVSLSPSGGPRKATEKDLRLSLRVPLEVWVLPQNPVVGKLQDTSLARPQTVVRHEPRDYSEIWKRKPFSDWVPPIPLKATIARPINVEKGQPATLEGTASGGDGEYIISWSPTEGLSDPISLRPTVNTSVVGTTTYTLSVTDGTPTTATASTSVTIREPKPPETVAVKTEPPPTPPPVDTRPKPWPDGRQMQIRMTLLRSMGSERIDEFMVYNNKSRQINYYKIGDEFDGGVLEYVHQLGGVVRRAEDYFVYPLGSMLDQHVDAKSAAEYPELQTAADRLREARRKLPPSPPKPAEPESKLDLESPEGSSGVVPPSGAEVVPGPALIPGDVPTQTTIVAPSAEGGNDGASKPAEPAPDEAQPAPTQPTRPKTRQPPPRPIGKKRP